MQGKQYVGWELHRNVTVKKLAVSDMPRANTGWSKNKDGWHFVAELKVQQLRSSSSG